MRALRRRKIICVCLIIISMIGIYLHFSYKSYSYYMSPAWNRVVKCVNSEEELVQLLNSTYQVHRILTNLGIDHWLMYGSIFGAMRMEGPLPWDNDVDIGFCGDCPSFASFSTVEDFVKSFRNSGFVVKNKWLQSGTITLSRPNQPLTLDLFAFYEHSGWKKRTGLESWLFFVNYNYHHTFPSWTVESPLPRVRFGHFNISIPKGEFEALKYLYRDNWWTEARPKGC